MKTIFIIHQWGPGHERAYTLSRALRRQGYRPLLTSDLPPGVNPLSWSLERMPSSDAVVIFSDIDGPGSYFEAGLAAGLRKPIIVVGTSKEGLIAELHGYPVVPSHEDSIVEEGVKRFLRQMGIAPGEEEAKTPYGSVLSVLGQSGGLIADTYSRSELVDIIMSAFIEAGYSTTHEYSRLNFAVDFYAQKGTDRIAVCLNKEPYGTLVSVSLVRLLLDESMRAAATSALLITPSQLTLAADEYKANSPIPVEVVHPAAIAGHLGYHRGRVYGDTGE